MRYAINASLGDSIKAANMAHDASNMQYEQCAHSRRPGARTGSTGCPENQTERDRTSH